MMIVICQSTGKGFLILCLISQVLCCSYVTPAERDQYYTLTCVDSMRLYGWRHHYRVPSGSCFQHKPVGVTDPPQQHISLYSFPQSLYLAEHICTEILLIPHVSKFRCTGFCYKNLQISQPDVPLSPHPGFSSHSGTLLSPTAKQQDPYARTERKWADATANVPSTPWHNQF